MKYTTFNEFETIWCVDFEFSSPPGELPHPICCVAYEINSSTIIQLWEDDLYLRGTPPYPIQGDSLFVAYYASAEIGCHLALNWPPPTHVLDLYVEFRNQTNGHSLPCGSGLLGALAYYGIPALEALQKDRMRQLALRGGPWTEEERNALLTYCESDVRSLARLLQYIGPAVDLPRALLRGRYAAAVARMERAGIPIDCPMLGYLRHNWEALQDLLIQKVDAAYGVFDGRTFKEKRFHVWLENNGLNWPRHPSGKLMLDEDTFRDMAKRYPQILSLRQLRATLAQMRLLDLPVGKDGRNRCLLSMFHAKTSRNQPSTTQFIFGPAVWLRSLIKPDSDHPLAYIDWCQQEFGAAAYLSGDMAMIQAYETGDPYLAFAIQAGAAPPEATKQSHSAIREQYKACALGVLYGMGPQALSTRIGQSPRHASALIDIHREMYPIFWRWSDAAVDHAMLKGNLYTVFGWAIHVNERTTARTLRNFPMQANGAEMLRLACCLATEQGIRICAPVHDALLVEGALHNFDETVKLVQHAMARASACVLGGHALRSEAKLAS